LDLAEELKKDSTTRKIFKEFSGEPAALVIYSVILEKRTVWRSGIRRGAASGRVFVLSATFLERLLGHS